MFCLFVCDKLVAFLLGGGGVGGDREGFELRLGNDNRKQSSYAKHADERFKSDAATWQLEMINKTFPHEGES